MRNDDKKKGNSERAEVSDEHEAPEISLTILRM
jgi:hypothetical protein